MKMKETRSLIPSPLHSVKGAGDKAGDYLRVLLLPKPTFN